MPPWEGVKSVHCLCTQAAFRVGPGWAPVGKSWAPNGPRMGLTGAHLGMLLGYYLYADVGRCEKFALSVYHVYAAAVCRYE